MGNCEICDRDDCATLLPPIVCRELPAGERWTGEGDDLECAGCVVNSERRQDCNAHRVDWRARCLAAEQDAGLAAIRERQLREELAECEAALMEACGTAIDEACAQWRAAQADPNPT